MLADRILNHGNLLINHALGIRRFERQIDIELLGSRFCTKLDRIPVITLVHLDDHMDIACVFGIDIDR
ncbi:hypothetical protein D3C80_1965540 [compost metagenome]